MELRSRSRNLLCLVSLPDSSVFEIEVKSLATGQEILNKVCERLNIIETDYFGLLHQTGGKNGGNIWLNLRNPLNHELSGCQPYRLMLRVKFYLPPHMIQQLTTRQQLYLNVREALDKGHLKLDTLPDTVAVAALIAQIEHGDLVTMNKPLVEHCYSSILTSCGCNSDDETIALIREEHLKLNGISPDSAKYQLLQIVSKLSSYGLQYYMARSVHGHGGSRMCVGVGPEGVVVCDKSMKELNRIPFSAILKLTHDGQNVILQVNASDSDSTVYHFRLDGRLSACALYRAMTEMYYFYRRDTVGSDVMTQYCRDLKGTLVSLFNENSSLGKSYMFDIERTQNEAYDRVRRILFNTSNQNVSLSGDSKQEESAITSSTCQCHAISKCPGCQVLRSSVQQIADCLTCRICADELIDVTFVSCGHTVCCMRCAERLDTCPLCKTAITLRLKVFLPWACPPVEPMNPSTLGPDQLVPVVCH